MTYDVDAVDMKYLDCSDGVLLARVYQPRGEGPFPLMVEVHGGAWCLDDRLHNAIFNEALAAHGIVVAAIDFRMPPVTTYPGSIADVNYAIRWFKTRAVQFGSRPEFVGVVGSSSGGHQAMLVAMRPRDPRYSSRRLPAGSSEVDATVLCVVMCWPVIDPLGRYRYVKSLVPGGSPDLERGQLAPNLPDASGARPPVTSSQLIDYHERYWVTEESMAEGNPTMALERGENVNLPPALYIQGDMDMFHPRPHLDRFVTAYRAAGGQVDLCLVGGESGNFILKDPSSAGSRKAISAIADFVQASAARYR
jgi:acetyl esterase